MNTQAVFSDGTAEYVQVQGAEVNDTVSIRLRAGGEDQLTVYLCTNEERVPMACVEKGVFTYYEASLRMPKGGLWYWFELQTLDHRTYAYDRLGVCERHRQEACFQLMPGFDVPEWAKGAVMYQILVDRFRNGDTANDVLDREYAYIGMHVKRVTDWDKLPEPMDVANFYGGDLAGVREKLQYLKNLGIEVIYFNPLFVSPSNHKYDTQDYDYIDPHIGKIVEDGGTLLSQSDFINQHADRYIRRVATKENLEASNAFFISLVQEAHALGMRVILDGVFNHCGSFHKWMDREKIYEKTGEYPSGAYCSSQSPYREYFGFRGESWPDNTEYEGWWDFETLPKLNYDHSQKLYDEILRIGAKWVSPPFNADGWRLDVAADLGHGEGINHRFWKDFRTVVKKANPQAIILAEHYGSATPWLQGDEWDTIMNYDAFMDPVTYFFTGMEKHSDRREDSLIGNGMAFENAMRHAMLQFMTPSLQCSMNQLSNHDHSRFLTRTNGIVGRVATHGSKAAGEGIKPHILRQATLLQMTWPGAPTLYYGDEAGVVGFTDPDSRRTYPWGREDKALLDYFRDVIALHKRNEVLKKGSFMFLSCENQLISYARFTKETQMVCVFYTGDTRRELSLPVWQTGAHRNKEAKRIFLTTKEGYSIMLEKTFIKDGNLGLVLLPNSGAVYQL